MKRFYVWFKVRHWLIKCSYLVWRIHVSERVEMKNRCLGIAKGESRLCQNILWNKESAWKTWNERQCQNHDYNDDDDEFRNVNFDILILYSKCYISAKRSNRPLSFYQFSLEPKTISRSDRRIGEYVSQIFIIERFNKNLSIASIQNRQTNNVFIFYFFFLLVCFFFFFFFSFFFLF